MRVLLKILQGKNNYAGISNTTTWLSPQAPPAATVSVSPSSLSFGFVAAGSSSASQTFCLYHHQYHFILNTYCSGRFNVSGINATFASSVVYTGGGTGRANGLCPLLPPSANTNYSGLINFTSTGLNDNKVNLDGNSNTGGTLNHYFGNLHFSSSYSDGNADDVTKIPSMITPLPRLPVRMDFLV